MEDEKTLSNTHAYLFGCVLWVIRKNEYNFAIPEFCHNPFLLPSLHGTTRGKRY